MNEKKHDIYPGAYLPVSREEMLERGWYYYDFLLITGDAYVDHPSFGAAVIGRVLEAEGYRVAILAQPGYRDAADIKSMGKPRYATLISAGNLDSMVAHYTASKRLRKEDFYSPGKKRGHRPDRATIVYSRLVREAFADLPIVIGGLEASLRRFAHYDYWDNSVMPPILVDSGADFIVYGMGEAATIELAKKLAAKDDICTITSVRGTGYMSVDAANCAYEYVKCASYEEVQSDKIAYAKSVMIQHKEHDPIRGRAVMQKCGDATLIINPPAMPLSASELDRVFALPFTREVHPMYSKFGGVPGIDEVRFSVIHNRGCFGACSFCALAFHQGRMVTARSHDSIIAEVQAFCEHPEFKGYVHDVGGPTANFRQPSCKIQNQKGMCSDRNCLSPEPCPNIEVDHNDYMQLLRKLSAISGVKKVFVRSGIRFDYLMLDKNGEFFADLVKNHISGQLKVAPEHYVNSVLHYMGKPKNHVFERFSEKYKKLNAKYGKNQYLVPYLISSHPGCTLADAIVLAEYLNRTGRQPEQVQDFYPTPGTLSTCMYYTGIDPRTMNKVHVPRSQEEKAMQRALLQWKKPENRYLVLKALKKAGREDLIGYGKHCLLRPKIDKRKSKMKT